MKAKQQLRKPENWQDFESLCKKLWGEVWQCKEIKKNGRQGQKQHGVDVYGVPKGEDSYYGIQCKGKDDYTNSQLSESEIDAEVKKALQFKPALKKLYFATTANKDAKIEEYVRSKDIENRNTGLFEVHLYSWEDIVDLIDENKETHDWYLKSHSYQTNHSVRITFGNEDVIQQLQIPFAKKIIRCKLRPKIDRKPEFTSAPISPFAALSIRDQFKQTRDVDKSFGIFNLMIHNTGNSPIENYKIHLEFDGSFIKLTGPSRGYYNRHSKMYVDLYPNTTIYEEEKRGLVEPKDKILVPNDFISFNNITVYPNYNSVIHVKWKLVSVNYETEGVLTLDIKPDMHEKIEYKFVEKEIEISEDEVSIEPYIVKQEYSIFDSLI